VSVIQLVTQAA